MPVPTPYEMIYSLKKLHTPEPPLPEKPGGPVDHYKRAPNQWAGTLIGEDLLPEGFSWIGYNRFAFRPPKRPAPPSWNQIPVLLPASTDDPYEDARKEYELIKKLNAQGNAQARQDFQNAMREMHGNLNDEEKELLTLADFVANESLEALFEPGMVTAMGILSDYWPRWFGGKASTTAKYMIFTGYPGHSSWAMITSTA